LELAVQPNSQVSDPENYATVFRSATAT